MNTENTNNHGPEIITRTTPAPWSITRTLTLDDGTELEAVRIEAETVEHYGQETAVGDWTCHLDDALFPGLTQEQLDEACDIASDILAAVSYRLSNGGTVLADEAADSDHEARWDAEQAAVDAALDDLRRLDRNGAAMATDGTLDGYTAAEKLEIIREAIATIKANA
jgi:hypothetical protein